MNQWKATAARRGKEVSAGAAPLHGTLPPRDGRARGPPASAAAARSRGAPLTRGDPAHGGDHAARRGGGRRHGGVVRQRHAGRQRKRRQEGLPQRHVLEPLVGRREEAREGERLGGQALARLLLLLLLRGGRRRRLLLARLLLAGGPHGPGGAQPGHLLRQAAPEGGGQLCVACGVRWRSARSAVGWVEREGWLNLAPHLAGAAAAGAAAPAAPPRTSAGEPCCC